MKNEKSWPRVFYAGSPAPRWVSDDISGSIGEMWGRFQTLTAFWLSPLTLEQVRCFYSHFVDVAAEPQKLCDLFTGTQSVVGLGVTGSWPTVFPVRFCPSCSFYSDALPLNLAMTGSYLLFRCFPFRCYHHPISLYYIILCIFLLAPISAWNY